MEMNNEVMICEHNDQPLELLCLTCNKLMCTKCIVKHLNDQETKKHEEIMHIKDIAKEYKDMKRNQKENLEKMANKLLKNQHEISKLYSKFEEKEQQINQVFDDIILKLYQEYAKMKEKRESVRLKLNQEINRVNQIILKVQGKIKLFDLNKLKIAQMMPIEKAIYQIKTLRKAKSHITKEELIRLDSPKSSQEIEKKITTIQCVNCVNEIIKGISLKCEKCLNYCCPACMKILKSGKCCPQCMLNRKKKCSGCGNILNFDVKECPSCTWSFSKKLAGNMKLINNRHVQIYKGPNCSIKGNITFKTGVHEFDVYITEIDHFSGSNGFGLFPGVEYQDGSKVYEKCIGIVADSTLFGKLKGTPSRLHADEVYRVHVDKNLNKLLIESANIKLTADLDPNIEYIPVINGGGDSSLDISIMPIPNFGEV